MSWNSQKVHYSSDNKTWGTPEPFMSWLKEEMNLEFALDAAATFQNKKAPRFFSTIENGLEQEWFGDVWLNPPYGRNLGVWLEKAAQEVENENARSVAVLIPARTDTKWFHEIVMERAYLVYFIKGRFKFVLPQSPPLCAPFPSMLVIFRPLPSVGCGLTTLEVPKEARGF